jgi:cell division protein FtsN
LEIFGLLGYNAYPRMNETYEFEFHRMQLMKVVGGLLSLVILVFCAGLLVGVGLQLRQSAPELVAQTALPSLPGAVPAAAPIVTPPPAPVSEEDKPAVEAPDGEASFDPDLPAIDDKPAAVAVRSPIERPQPAVAVPGLFAVQFGAFLQSENAGVLAKRLTAKGYGAAVVAREDSQGRTWYLVRYGAFPNRAQAAAAAVEVKARESVDAVVRPSDSM